MALALPLIGAGLICPFVMRSEVEQREVGETIFGRVSTYIGTVDSRCVSNGSQCKTTSEMGVLSKFPNTFHMIFSWFNHVQSIPQSPRNLLTLRNGRASVDFEVYVKGGIGVGILRINPI